MPFFSGPITNRQILIGVAVTRPDEKGVQLGSPKHSYRAMVDTGATATCISPKVVANLQLLSEGKRLITSATQQTEVNQYHVNLHIPITSGIEISILTKLELEVTEISQPKDYDVLLGMDLLERCSLFISGGQFTFCY